MSTVIIGDKEVQSVKWRDEYVMTTETLAYFFEVPKANIKKNFVRNLDRFIESKHYFKVEGRELRDLVTNCPQVLSKNTPMLYLWTRRGVARHAKMINSDVAWDVFELLEDAYFNRDTENPTDNSTLPGADFWWEVNTDGYDDNRNVFDLLPTVDELNDVEIEADSDETTATVEAETPAVIDFSDEADMFTPDLEPELTQSRLVPDNNVTVEEPDFSDWDAELEAEMKAEFAEVEASLQDLQTSLEIEISEGNLDNAQIIAEKIVELNARYGYLYEQIYGHTVEIFTDPAQVIADAIEITAIVDEEQRKVFDETVAEIKTPAAELKAKYDASDDEDERVEICVEAYRNYIEPKTKQQEREIAKAVANTMNADAPAGWKITPTKSGNFQILHGDNVEFVDTITAGDYLNPKEFFDQFRQTREQEDDEREAALRQEERERDQLIAMRDELVANFPDDIKRLRTLNEMIEEHEDNIAMLESLLRRPPDKVVDFDKQGNITQVWF